MFTSVNKHTRRALAIYAGITAFCLLFSAIYYQFSHDVHSAFMTFLFAIPLIGGAGVAALRAAMGAREAPAAARYYYHAAIATATVGCALRGIFEIAGTSSPYLSVYLAATAALIGAACYTYIMGFRARMLTHERETPDART